MQEALTKEQVRQAINFGGKTPQTISFWLHPDAYSENSEKEKVKSLLEEYPSDILLLSAGMPGYGKSSQPNNPSYVWGIPKQSESSAIDAQLLISDWNELDGFLAAFPKASKEAVITNPAKIAAADKTNRYRLGHFWYFFYERLWSFRGMENTLIDMHTNPDEIKRLFEVLSDFYIEVIEHLSDELGCDGFFVSDDLGSQQNLMFSPEMFRTLFKPFYAKVIEACHKKGMHFWLHTCGNVESIIPDLIEVGVDVLHPIQKHTMDEAVIANKYRKDLCFMCGMDVQQTMPFGSDLMRFVRRFVT